MHHLDNYQVNYLIKLLKIDNIYKYKASELVDFFLMSAGSAREFGTDELPSDWLYYEKSQFLQICLSFAVSSKEQTQGSF